MKTLWEQLGGDAKVEAIVNDFVELATANRKANYTRSGRYPLSPESLRHAKREALAFISQAAGGPQKYTGRSLVAIHKGMAITDPEFDLIASDFKTALEKNGTEAALVNIIMNLVAATRDHIVEAR